MCFPAFGIDIGGQFPNLITSCIIDRPDENDENNSIENYIHNRELNVCRFLDVMQFLKSILFERK
jgi:hypothetical protein